MKNYEIGDIIDSGGMGVVYKGRHVGLERDVAIKFILPHVASDEASVERFLREARLAGRINHPNVTHIYDTGVDEQGRPYIVMELLTGEPLKQRLSRGSMTESDAIEITKQVLLALEKAHSMGVIHRDIKPGNIFLTTERMAKILDFGVAKGLDSGSGNVTLAGKTVGSPAYMSPEQAEGETVDARTDLYSVGIVLYEMLSGAVPFRGENSLAIMQKHLSTPPPPLPNEVHGSLKAVVEKALAKKVDKRYASARDMLNALEKAPLRNVVVAKPTTAEGAAVAGQPTPVPGRKSTKSQETATATDSKKSAPWALIGIAGALLVGGAIFGIPMLMNSMKAGGAQSTGSTGGETSSGTTSGQTTGGETAGTSGTTSGTTGDTTSGTTGETTAGTTGETTAGTTSGTTGETTSGTTGETTSGTTGDPTTGTTSGTTGTGSTSSGTTGGEELRTETKTETEPIPFQVKTTDDPNLDAGQTKVVTQGVAGEREVTYDVSFRGTEVVSKTKTGERVVREPVDKVVTRGTKVATSTTVDRTERETIRFRTIFRDVSTMPKGRTRVEQEGKNGVRSTTYRVTMQGGKVISRTRLSSTVIEAPVNRIMLRGTGGGTGGTSTGGGTKPKFWHCTECGRRYSNSSMVCPYDGTRRP